MTKMLIFLILAMCSCKSMHCKMIPRIEPQERCTISFHFQSCFCHEYDVYNAKRIGEVYEMDLDYCEEFTGFHKNAWAIEITPWMKESIRLRSDYCGE